MIRTDAVVSHVFVLFSDVDYGDWLFGYVFEATFFHVSCEFSVSFNDVVIDLHLMIMRDVGFKPCLILLKRLNRHLLKSLSNLLNNLLYLPTRLRCWRRCQYDLRMLLLSKLLVKAILLLLYLGYFLFDCHFHWRRFFQWRSWDWLDKEVLHVYFVLSNRVFRFL